MKLIITGLGVLIVSVHFGLWFGHHSVSDWIHLTRDTGQLSTEVSVLAERNLALRAEVEDLRNGLDAVEERARADLGLIRRDETFFQIIEPASPLATSVRVVQPRY